MVRTLCCVSLALAAGSALGQVGLPGTSVYASGIRHDSVGGATFGPLNGRRLPVHNLGSSGQDGVEIRFDAAFGSGLELDMSPIRESPTLATAHVRYKGWDGTIKGRVSLTGAAGTPLLLQCDFAECGATSVSWRCEGDNGVVLASGVAQGHSFSWGTSHPQSPPGSGGRMAINTKGTGATNGRSCRVEFPDGACQVLSLNGLPPGTPVLGCRAIEFTCDDSSNDARTSSAEVTATGISSFELTGALYTGPCRPPYLCDFMWDDLTMFGLGDAHVEETCSPNGDCDDADPSSRYYTCSNIGSSGQDGVSIDFGPSSSGSGQGIQLSKKHTKTGHVTLLKKYGSNGAEVARTTVSDGGGGSGGSAGELITFDATAMGAASVLVTVYDPDGNPTGSELILGPLVAIAVPLMCPNGGIWCAFGSPPRWGCYIPTQFVLPGGTVLNGNSISMEAFTASGGAMPHVRRVEITGNAATGGFQIDDISPPTCPADLDDGTGTGTPDTGVDINDLLYFLEHFEVGC